MPDEGKSDMDLYSEDFPFEGNLERKTHTLEDLEILNESATCHIVLDFSGVEQMHVWANAAYLQAVEKTQEEFREWTYSQCSASMRQVMSHYHQQIQIQKCTARWTHTTYPKKGPLKFYLVQRPFRLQIKEEVKTLIFSDLIPIREDKSDAFRPLEELLRFTNVGQLMVDAESLEVQIGNPAAQFSYKCKKDFTLLEGSARLKLDDILSSCVWESEERRAAVLDQITSLTLQSDPVEVEVQKEREEAENDGSEQASQGRDSVAASMRAYGGAKTVTHKLVIFPAVHPATGKDSLMITEYDISELKKTQEELEEANALQELAFTSISHELRTPLNGIVGLADAVLLSPKLSPSLLSSLQVIRAQGMRLNGLVNDILDAASHKRGTLVIAHAALDLHQITEDTCAFLRPLLRKSVRLVNGIAPGALPAVEADRNRITQVLTNLVSNAIKFTDKGSITVRARLEGSSAVTVEVVDTGRGIPAHKVEGVWGAFTQESKQTAKKYGGTGLGLSLVKALVEAHGGSCAVVSRYRQVPSGCTFSFTIPLRPRDSGTRTPSSSSAGSVTQESFDLALTRPHSLPEDPPPADPADAMEGSAGEAVDEETDDDGHGFGDVEGRWRVVSARELAIDERERDVERRTREVQDREERVQDREAATMRRGWGEGQVCVCRCQKECDSQGWTTEKYAMEMEVSRLQDEVNVLRAQLSALQQSMINIRGETTSPAPQANVNDIEGDQDGSHVGSKLDSSSDRQTQPSTGHDQASNERRSFLLSDGSSSAQARVRKPGATGQGQSLGRRPGIEGEAWRQHVLVRAIQSETLARQAAERRERLEASLRHRSEECWMGLMCQLGGMQEQRPRRNNSTTNVSSASKVAEQPPMASTVERADLLSHNSTSWAGSRNGQSDARASRLSSTQMEAAHSSLGTKVI